MTDDWNQRLASLGTFIKDQRRQAQLSLRELSDLAQVSNPYLSQIERGLHEPSVRILRSIAKALNISAESLLDQAGLLDDAESTESAKSPKRRNTTEDAISADTALTKQQRDALIAVYRTYRRANQSR